MFRLASQLCQTSRHRMPFIAVNSLAIATAFVVLGAAGPLRAASDGVPAKIFRYAQWIVFKYDENGNEQLESSEWRWMHGTPKLIDLDTDGVITIEEFTDYIVRYGGRRRIQLSLAQSAPSASDYESTTKQRPVRPIPPRPLSSKVTTANVNGPVKAPKSTKFHVDRSRLPKGLPTWFPQKDKDGDGQLTLAEFAPSVTATLMKEFNRYDKNRDGVLTAAEVAPTAVAPQKPQRPTFPSSQSATPAPAVNTASDISEQKAARAAALAALRAAKLKRPKPTKTLIKRRSE